MKIWFYFFLIALLFLIVSTLKIIKIKKEIHQISKSIQRILASDTNNIITIDANDLGIQKLTNTLNQSIKNLRELQIEYKNGNEELKSSITNISHDLRTPLTAIKGYLDLINRQNLQKNQKKYLKIIDQKVEYLIELTEQLFDFSKILDIQEKIPIENICINDILEESICSFYHTMKKYKITPKIEICEEKVIRSLNENMLKRILENVLSNAIKYGKKNIHITLENQGKIRISNPTEKFDWGNVKKIFERYYTIENTKESTGIGLSIAKQLVNQMNGTIKAKYKEGTLTIEICFPKNDKENFS